MPTPPAIVQAAPPWRQALRASYARGGRFLWFLVKMVLPWYLASELLLRSGVLAHLSSFLAPVMGLWGLPPEAAAVLLAGMLVNLYAAAAVAAPLALSWQQVSVLGLILGICHSLLVEAVVVRELTPRYRALTLLRLGLGLGAGWLLALALC
ncbi:MAG: nucleoside recognition protein [Desulfarculus sp.]|nr:MAG: nucleoside recognition protein [Desulfarculus sp.]